MKLTDAIHAWLAIPACVFIFARRAVHANWARVHQLPIQLNISPPYSCCSHEWDFTQRAVAMDSVIVRTPNHLTERLCRAMTELHCEVLARGHSDLSSVRVKGKDVQFLEQFSQRWGASDMNVAVVRIHSRIDSESERQKLPRRNAQLFRIDDERRFVYSARREACRVDASNQRVVFARFDRRRAPRRVPLSGVRESCVID